MARPLAAAAVAVAALAAWSRASALPTYFNDFHCVDCHAAAGNTTCAGCHAHGTHSNSSKSDINVSGTPDKTTYQPGETVTVSITGGYQAGWVRAVLYDENLHELARATGATSATTFPGPIQLHAPAPAAPGSYSWSVAWYGNNVHEAANASYGAGMSATLAPGFFTPDTSNPNHGWQTVQMAAFTVAAADAGTPDAGTPDAGAADAGTGTDAGTTADAGAADAGELDAGTGTPDAGAGTNPDGGATTSSSSSGCSSAGGAFGAALLVSLAALALRRRPRRGA